MILKIINKIYNFFMGACCFPRNSIMYRIDTFTNIPHQTNLTTNLITTNENIEEKFNDMPEVSGNIFVNYGIKRMKGYKCSLNIDELNVLRERFWQVKINLNERFKFLRQAVLYDSKKCEDYIIKNGFYTIDGCINHCSDNTKYNYIIPNYCINDPYFEKQLDDIVPNREKKKIIIYLRKNDDKEKLEIFDDISGKDLKEKYIDVKNLKNISSIRLFFGGNEIKDNDLLYQHKIMNKYCIQVVIIE